MSAINPPNWFWTTRNDLVRKKLVPKHTLGYFDDVNVKKAWAEYETDPLKSHSCPHCHITIKGSRMWMRQHIKTHSQKMRYQEKLRDNDIHKTETKVYFE